MASYPKKVYVTFDEEKNKLIPSGVTSLKSEAKEWVSNEDWDGDRYGVYVLVETVGPKKPKKR